jgi:hypothetical protein
MLAASRKAKASQPLMSFAITAANRAMGSAPGIVHVPDSITTLNASVGNLKKNFEPGLCNKKNEVASSGWLPKTPPWLLAQWDYLNQ